MNKSVSEKKFWEQYAAIYDILLIFKSYRDYLSDVRTVSEVRTGMRIGDFGCGTGNLLVELYRTFGNSISMLGYDFSEIMLQQAKQKKAFMSSAIHLEQRDLTKTTVLEQKFDVIFCLQMLYSLRNPSYVIHLSWDHLKTDGKLVVVTPRRTSYLGLILRGQLSHSKDDVEHWRTNEGKKLLQLAHDIFGDQTIADILGSINNSLTIQALQRFKKRRILDVLVELAEINVGLVRESEKSGHFFTHEELKTLLTQKGFCITTEKQTYANQCHLMVARKPKISKEI